jgi:hypothetical protein
LISARASELNENILEMTGGFLTGIADLLDVELLKKQYKFEDLESDPNLWRLNCLEFRDDWWLPHWKKGRDKIGPAKIVNPPELEAVESPKVWQKSKLWYNRVKAERGCRQTTRWWRFCGDIP